MLLTEEYTRAKLADFDSAKRLPDEYTEAGLKPLGTKGFAAPEVLKQVLFNHGFVGLKCCLLVFCVSTDKKKVVKCGTWSCMWNFVCKNFVNAISLPVVHWSEHMTSVQKVFFFGDSEFCLKLLCSWQTDVE